MGENQATSIQFEHFDVVPTAADRYCVNSNLNSRKCFQDTYAKIIKEWKILERNLPESIYVKVYEERIDLLRAVIVGSAGTPYHDGLFFFDILLPSDYPKSPPQLHYHSHGYRLNPNLYASGKVCLSLLNTWVGSKAEKWRKESTILQVLVSIQGLVLNERPYFNEPGFEDGKNSNSSSWINRSLHYNENAFILSCKTMLQTMRKPPKNFERFVAQHFQGRAASIMAAIEAYLKGQALVGEFQMNGPRSSSMVTLSEKFKANLVKIQSDLEIAFARLNKNEECGEASASTSNTDQTVENGWHEELAFSVEEPQESVAQHKNLVRDIFIYIMIVFILFLCAYGMLILKIFQWSNAF